MHLGELIDFVGNLLDYDPTNETYREQVVSILNDAQTRTLTDRAWDFSQKDRELQVYTDVTASFAVTFGSATVTGAGFPFNVSEIMPGSRWEGGIVTITDSAGTTEEYTIRFVRTAAELHLDRLFNGASGTYNVVIKFRDIKMPSDTMTILNVSDPHVGIPAKAAFLSKWEREEANLDPDLLGTVEAYLPSSGTSTPAPLTVRGVTVHTPGGSGHGVRTINVYMVNVRGPASTNFPLYRRDVSDGFESALSKVQSFSLGPTETLIFEPETIPNSTGLYRRYYFTCPEAGILAPVRIRNNTTSQPPIPAPDTDTVPPTGGMVLHPALTLLHLQGQAFQSTAIRYIFNNSAAYTSIQLFPHPAADQKLNVRSVITPRRMMENQDAPLVPASYAQVIAYAALESLTLKVDNPALSAVYLRKKEVLYKGMEQRFLQRVPRRIVKGQPLTAQRYGRNPFGPLVFT